VLQISLDRIERVRVLSFENNSLEIVVSGRGGHMRNLRLQAYSAATLKLWHALLSEAIDARLNADRQLAEARVVGSVVNLLAENAERALHKRVQRQHLKRSVEEQLRAWEERERTRAHAEHERDRPWGQSMLKGALSMLGNSTSMPIPKVLLLHATPDESSRETTLLFGLSRPAAEEAPPRDGVLRRRDSKSRTNLLALGTTLVSSATHRRQSHSSSSGKLLTCKQPTSRQLASPGVTDKGRGASAADVTRRVSRSAEGSGSSIRSVSSRSSTAGSIRSSVAIRRLTAERDKQDKLMRRRSSADGANGGGAAPDVAPELLASSRGPKRLVWKGSQMMSKILSSPKPSAPSELIDRPWEASSQREFSAKDLNRAADLASSSAAATLREPLSPKLVSRGLNRVTVTSPLRHAPHKRFRGASTHRKWLG